MTYHGELAKHFREEIERIFCPKPKTTVFLRDGNGEVKELEWRPLALQEGYVKLRVAGERDHRWVMESAWRNAQDHQRIHNGLEPIGRQITEVGHDGNED
jgi:hypothetical protein